MDTSIVRFYGANRSAGFCRSPHPPIMSVSPSDKIQKGYRIVLGAIGI